MSFARLLSEALASSELPTTGDVLAVGLPLLRQLDELHADGLIGLGAGIEGVVYDGARLALVDPSGRTPRTVPIVDELNPPMPRHTIEIAQRLEQDLGFGHGSGGGRYHSADVFDPDDTDDELPRRPVFVVGYRAWEQLHAHHDALTDMHLAGLILTSYAVGLDLMLASATDELALGHRHLTRMNPALHPVVANVLGEMIRPDRHARPPTMGEVAARLQHHRELPVEFDLTDAYEHSNGRSMHWREGVLASLRERIFDTSRRNRALYFKPSASALSLTEASVPLLLDVERVDPSQLLTWTGEAAAVFRKGKPVDLERWCRFEESPHLVPGLEKLISSERKLRAEHGQGRLRLIIAFLRWVDPENDEEIHSPLLTMPAALSRKKGVKPRYFVSVEPEAEVNPVLRYVLGSRFDLQLPERIAADDDSIASFVAELEAAVQRSDPGISINLIDTPRISLIRRRAQLRVDAYLRRRAQSQASSGRWRRNDYSYDSDDWRPLGLALYRRFIEPGDLPLRQLAGADPTVRGPSMMVATDAGKSEATRERDSYALQRSDISRQRWEVDLCAVTLASLGSRRSTLARDYDELLDRAEASSNTNTDGESTAAAPSPFDAMFSPDHRKRGLTDLPPISLDQMLVLPADSTQAVSVRRSLEGDSFIIQGPPGTGKSQTITNLIAALVADEKRVLFVCEKRAALDVVAHRLDQVGLGPLVATIHDAELDRKPFIAELGETYAAWIGDESDDDEQRRAIALASAEKLLAPLAATFADLHLPRHGSHSIAALVERLIVLRTAGVGEATAAPAQVDITDWLEARPALDATQAALASAGLPTHLGSHFVLRATPEFVASGNTVHAIPQLGKTITEAIDALQQALPPGLDLAEIRLGDLDAIATDSEWLEQLFRTGSTSLADRTSDRHAELRSADALLRQLTEACEANRGVLERWTDPLTADDARTGLALAREAERSLLRFMNRRWRSLRDLVRTNYRFEQHDVEPTVEQVLTDLLAWHDAEQALNLHRGHLIDRFGTDDTAALLSFLDRASTNLIARHLLDNAGTGAGVPPMQGAAPNLDVLGTAATALTVHCPHLLFAEQSSLADLRSVAVGLGSMSVAHERALLAWSDLRGTSVPVLHAALSQANGENDGDGGSNHLDVTERAVLEQMLEQAGSDGRLGQMTSAQLDDTVRRLLDTYQGLLATNASVVLGRARRRFASHTAFSEASMAGRSDDDKDRKRSYAAGRRILEREFNKKMRFRPIRELASGDSGLVVRDLKPVWLMSPISVSTTLPLDDDLFDVVVFDEASQITVEDAVPTLHRAGQAIVVGDRMQLPPTRFFSSTSTGDDGISNNGALVDGSLVGGPLDDDGDIGLSISLDADSFLTQADQSFDSMMLSWHYRSRSESLISFSNVAFYGGRLATVPDRGFPAGPRHAITAANPEDARSNVAAALDRPISFHHIESGVYGDRRNEPEADYVAELVRSLLVDDNRLTIGIAAFSETQQTAIEDALAELAAGDAVFALALEAEIERVEDGEFVGLFVKNLENVQGDERDIIIMSVCYAPAADGKMRMNFGPINQAGGERRLNVIFSRSKRHMMIVSTIKGPQITNTHNDGAASLARFLSYAEAESRGDELASAASLAALRSRGTDSIDVAATSAVVRGLADSLIDRGWAVDLDVGRSVFTIDAAVRGDDGYLLGVMIDPGDEAANATSRLVADAGVLAAFGWPVTRVFISEWLLSPTQVTDRIDQLLRSRLSQSTL